MEVCSIFVVEQETLFQENDITANDLMSCNFLEIVESEKKIENECRKELRAFFRWKSQFYSISKKFSSVCKWKWQKTFLAIKTNWNVQRRKNSENYVDFYRKRKRNRRMKIGCHCLCIPFIRFAEAYIRNFAHFSRAECRQIRRNDNEKPTLSSFHGRRAGESFFEALFTIFAYTASPCVLISYPYYVHFTFSRARVCACMWLESPFIFSLLLSLSHQSHFTFYKNVRA